MRTANFRDDILHPVASRLGIDHTSPDLNVQHVRGWIPFINTRMEEAWESLDLPELRATEERAFRTIWNATGQFLRSNPALALAGEPDSFLYLPTMGYYQVKATAIADPPPGALPTDTTYFEPIAIGYPYIDLDQRGRHAVGEVLGVYNGNPRFQTTGWTGLPYRLSERGIELRGTSAPSAWLRFTIRPSKFTAEQWDNEAVYQKGALVYNPEDGHCYRSLIGDNQGTMAPANVWALVPVPAALATYVALAAASDAADDLPTSQKLYAQAQAVLVRKYDALRAQGETRRYRLFDSTRTLNAWGGGSWWYNSPFWVPADPSELTTLTDIWSDDEFYNDPYLLDEAGAALLA